jgi:aerobic-type carbon monoxide dehydrogenase small subunit (CoxS/CutS family)
MAISVTVNGQPQTLDLDPDTPLLWALRDTLGLTGTKFGCGISACGACTVHVDGKPMRSCSVPVIAVEGTAVTTIEGLAPEGNLHPVQQAWIDHQVPQCGYCQSGMIMAVSALLAAEPHPTEQQVDEAITNICRCGTFARVRRAIQALAPPEPGSPPRVFQRGGVVKAGPGDAALARRSHSTYARRSEAEPR